MFCHNLIDLPILEQINSLMGRRYKTPDGNLYPSVTTVLDKTLDKTGLEEWKAAVGEEEARRVARIAANRGTQVHELCEDYIMNEPLRKAMPLSKMMFNQIKTVLDENVDNIRVSEGRLYSDKLMVAGSVDLLANWKQEKATIDFKTSIREKEREWIDGYFLQTSMYAFMAWERTGIFHNKIVIIIAIEEGNKAQVFTDKATNWIDKAQMLCKAYHLEERNYGE